ncbi:MAG: ABC transporter ATP-binding protein [Hyphomicrobiaceae bacterium]|nr:ABC transporter ATP-binding protein [Hyphomicrobiaceae bacterium]MCC0025282.1 ABC transporter ATP-binding protein [Hyphomicrobiaceae bacterium]
MLSWFERRLDPYPVEEPEQPPKGLWAFCLHYSEGAKLALTLMAMLSALIAILEVAVYGFIGAIVNWISNEPAETFLSDHGWALAGMLVTLLVVLPVMVAINAGIRHQTLMGNLPQRIRWFAHRYILRQSMSYFQDEFAGRITTKLMQTSLAVREVAIKILDVFVYVAVYFLSAIVMAASADGWLALPFIVWLGLYFALMVYFVPRMSKVSEEQADARALMTGQIVDSYTNISTIKLFSHNAREESYVRRSMDGFLDTVYRQMRYGTFIDILVTVLNVLLVVSLAALGISQWMAGQLEAGPIAAALAIATRMQGMSHWVIWEMAALFENIGTVRDGINSISVPRLVIDKPNAAVLARAKGEVSFDDVSFSYNANGADGDQVKVVIDGLNLGIPAGRKIGLVGRSGAGKSTLVNLLLRFFDVEKGKITIDGVDIGAVTQESLRSNIGMVSQDTSLLHRSVRENIAYGKPDATDEEIMSAARMAEADEFIAHLVDAKGRRGLDAHVGERGVKLSGGQRQRIAIARVLLKDAPILVLDEATSALDSEVEAAIQSQFELLMQGKTVIAIAHRLSTIAAMDHLVILDQGKIVEQGSHEELLARGGTYARLWEHQSGGFLHEDEDVEAAE